MKKIMELFKILILFNFMFFYLIHIKILLMLYLIIVYLCNTTLKGTIVIPIDESLKIHVSRLQEC